MANHISHLRGVIFAVFSLVDFLYQSFQYKIFSGFDCKHQKKHEKNTYCTAKFLLKDSEIFYSFTPMHNYIKLETFRDLTLL